MQGAVVRSRPRPSPPTCPPSLLSVFPVSLPLSPPLFPPPLSPSHPCLPLFLLLPPSLSPPLPFSLPFPSLSPFSLLAPSWPSWLPPLSSLLSLLPLPGLSWWLAVSSAGVCRAPCRAMFDLVTQPSPDARGAASGLPVWWVMPSFCCCPQLPEGPCVWETLPPPLCESPRGWEGTEARDGFRGAPGPTLARGP